MYTRRICRIKKRKRWIFIKKLLTGFTTFFLILCLGVSLGFDFAGKENVQVAENSEIENSEHKYYKSIELKSGDTLWTIAQAYMDEYYDSAEDYVKELIEINGLSSNEIQDGAFLIVSYYKH